MDKLKQERLRHIKSLKEGSEMVLPLKTQLEKFFVKEAAEISYREINEQIEYDTQHPKFAKYNSNRFTIRLKQPPQMIEYALNKIIQEERFEKISEREKGRLLLRFLEKRRNPLNNHYFNQMIIQESDQQTRSKNIEIISPKHYKQKSQISPMTLNVKNLASDKSKSSVNSLTRIPNSKEAQAFLNMKIKTRSRVAQSLQLDNVFRDTPFTGIDSESPNLNLSSIPLTRSFDYHSISPRQLNESHSRGRFILPLIPKHLNKSKPDFKNLQNVIQQSTDHFNEVNSNEQLHRNNLQFKSFQQETTQFYSINKRRQFVFPSPEHRKQDPIYSYGKLSNDQSNSLFENASTTVRTLSTRNRQNSILKKSIQHQANEQFKELEETIRICDSLVDRNKDQKINKAEYNKRMSKIIKRRRVRKNSNILVKSIDHIH
eukprot:403343434